VVPSPRMMVPRCCYPGTKQAAVSYVRPSRKHRKIHDAVSIEQIPVRGTLAELSGPCLHWALGVLRYPRVVLSAQPRALRADGELVPELLEHRLILPRDVSFPELQRAVEAGRGLGHCCGAVLGL
jgi:hypothetical protein